MFRECALWDDIHVGSTDKLNRSATFIVHGFRSDSSSLNQMTRVLSAKQKVIPVDIDITYHHLEIAVAQLKEIVTRFLCAHPTRRINFVAHSTGGIVVRLLLKDSEISDKTAACVFISVPNNGTVLADAHQKIIPEPFRSLHKPIENITRSFIHSLDLECPEHVAYGGIAGLKNWGITNAAFSGPNDGVVAVSSVYLYEMVDFIQVPCDHLSIMKDFSTSKATLNFIENFSFNYS